MEIGRRLRELRKGRRLSQGELEIRTGLLRCYTSRVENGHTVPSVETIEKYSIALGIPLAEFFSKGVVPLQVDPLAASEAAKWRPTPREQIEREELVAAIAATETDDRELLTALAQRLAKRNRIKRRRPAIRVA
jgi:transcriptional regulator with XRE-family HTH domain